MKKSSSEATPLVSLPGASVIGLFKLGTSVLSCLEVCDSLQASGWSTAAHCDTGLDMLRE